MILGPSLERYAPLIKDAIFDYAYANYHMKPVLENVEIDQWVGEIFEVAKIKEELHEDLIKDLKDLKLYDDIVKTCDKFVILPDVWSTAKIPITGPLYPRNQYDTDRRNIVIINNKIFDLKDVKMKSIWYNHNRLLYCFFNSSLSDGIFNTQPGKKPEMSVIWLYDHGFMIDNIKGNEDKWNIAPDDSDRWFKFMLDENNKVTTNNSIDRVGIAVNMHWILFDYENEVDPRVEVHIPGANSNNSKDTWIRPKWYNMEDENRAFIHNTNVLFTNTAIIFYKDKSYKIVNTYTTPRVDGYEKIDKHTIRIDKDENIAKVVVFVRPYDPKRYPPADSLYYKAVAENMYAAERLKKYRKYTNDLFEYITYHNHVTLDWFINYGYKYDKDILKVIQNFFKTVIDMNPMTDVSYVEPDDKNMFFKPKIVVRVWNKLQYYPLLFINHKMYMADYRIIKHDDDDLIVIDPEQFFKLCDDKGVVKSKAWNIDNSVRGVKLDEYVPPAPEHDNYRDVAWIKKNFEKVVEDMKIVFTGYNYLDVDKCSRQGGRIFRTPIYKNELILDEVGDYRVNPLFRGFQFVNGCLSNERFEGDLFRRLDGVNLFDCGSLDFSVVNKSNPSDYETYHIVEKTAVKTVAANPEIIRKGQRSTLKIKFNDTVDGEVFLAGLSVVPNDIEIGNNAVLKMEIADPEQMRNKDSIFNKLNTSLLINRTKEPLIGICKAYIGEEDIHHVCNYTHADTMRPIDVDGKLNENHTIVFDKYGYECVDNVDILSSRYASCDNMYNYVAGNGLYDEICVHFIPVDLQDDLRQFNLNIDESRVSNTFNRGCYNDNAMEDVYVRALFLPNEPSEIRPIPVSVKSNRQLLGEKILTRYWLGSHGTIVDKDTYAKETKELNGTFVNSNGTLGNVPNEFKAFIANDELRGNIPLIKYIVGQDTLYNMFVGYGINYINFNENYVDSSNRYDVDMSDVYAQNTKDDTLYLFMDNDMFIKKEEE